MTKELLLATAAIVAMVNFANATVVQTVGAGSAVTTIQAAANFEHTNAVSDNPYVEDGISFSRTGLSFDNNGCGYAGCGYAFPYFSGNYMYATGSGGFFTLASPTATPFTGLEFVAGSGYGGGTENFTWQALLGGNLVGSGNGIVDPGTRIGFADPGGFDTLQWTEINSGTADFSGTNNAPAFDSVTAQFAVPEPISLALLGTGLASLGVIRRKRT